MSGWRVVVRQLHEAGRPLRSFDLLVDNAGYALAHAARLGLVKSPGRWCYRVDTDEYGVWELTPLGVDFAEGRVVRLLRQRRHRPTDRNFIVRFQATWLAALPRANEVRLTCACASCTFK